MSTAFGFQPLVELCRQTHEMMQSRAVRSVDLALVVRNWLFGWYIVGFEQDGTDRAQYGQATLKKLSTALRETIGRGFSVDNLELMRHFFMTYRNTLPIDSKSETLLRMSGAEISETVSRNSAASPKPTIILPTSPALIAPELIEKLLTRFTLGWSHHVTLLSVDSPEERRFYEIEATA
jgi:DUF1016 N-terminal domain